MNTTVVLPARRSLIFLALLVLLLVGSQTLSAGSASADPNPEYDSIPVVYPPSFVSLGFQATATSSFGDHIQLAGTDRVLESLTVGLNDWACESDFTLAGNVWTPTGLPCTTTPGSSFSHPITVNLYAVDNSVPPPALGALLATRTEVVTVPFRPSANPGVGPGLCGPGATQWFNPGTGTCHNGYAFNATFDFSALNLLMPEEMIVVVAYNTQTYGTPAIGAAGPYNSLNVSLANDPPSVGSIVEPDIMFRNLNREAGWSGFDGLVLAINATSPVQPATLPDTGVSELGFSWIVGAGILMLGGVFLAVGRKRTAD